ncbi:hypothetical protein RB195_002680 [Necator americanus]|uniref:Sulfotransferase family protein n=1 Tax=Necator americanus TaxID=51031 RepID=A0ABR1DK60_NECAM
MCKETSCHLYLIYCILFILTVARIKEVISYEHLRNDAELQTAIRNYGLELGSEMAQRAYSILRRFCPHKRKCELISPFKKYYPQYAIAGWPMRVSSCMIPKNMSTVLSAIFCLLFTDEIGKTNSTVTSMLKRNCATRNELNSFSQIEKLAHGKRWMNFALVRDPAERFLSGFMFMCSPNNVVENDCDGCIGDIKCALRQTLKYSHQFANKDLSAANYILWHLGPQNWHCDFQHNFKKFELIQYSPKREEQLASDLRYVLEEGGVAASHIDLIITQLSNSTTLHATSHLTKKNFYETQMNDPEVEELLVKIFFWDYILLNYPLPNLQ